MMKRLFSRCAAAAVVLIGATVHAEASGADLTIAQASVSASNALADQQVAVSIDVHNQGIGPAAPSRVKYYFSADDQWDGADTYLNYDNVGALAAGATGAETANVRVPAGTPDGLYHVLAVVDVDGDIAESDESNNVVALPLMVGTPALGTDFAVAQAQLSTGQADPNEVLSIDLDVLNLGAVGSGLETRVKYYLSTDDTYDAADTYLNWDRVSPLASGAASAESANLRVPASTAPGMYWVVVVADQTELVAETDESNNVVALPLVVGAYTPQASLAVGSATLGAAWVRTGESVTAGAVIDSIGDIGAGEAKLRYMLSADATWDTSDKQLSWDKVDALAAGASGAEDATLNISTATAAGDYFVLFVVASDPAADEHHEADDVFAVPLSVTRDNPTAPLADLTVTGSLDATTVPAGSTVGVTATVSNVGVAAAGTSRLKYYFSTDPVWDEADSYLNYDAVGGLAVGANSAENATLTVPAVADGLGYILMVVDAVDDVAEQYESDNVVPLAFTVGTDAGPGGPVDQPGLSAPDLVVDSAWVDDVEVRAGERATLHVVVRNQGSQAAPPTRVKYYLSRDANWDPTDRYASYDNVAALGAAATSNEDVMPLVPETTAHGTWYLLAVVDANDDTVESFESNNVHAVAIQVVVDDPNLDAPDLVADPPVLSKAIVQPGRVLDLTTMVSNDGSQAASESRLKMYLSDDDFLDAGDIYLGYANVEALPVGASTTVSAHLRVPVEAAHGSTRVLVFVDCDREHVESYESNNLVSTALTVGAETAAAPNYPYVCPSHVFTDPTLLAMPTVATFNALHLGWNNGKDMLALACVVSHFDLIGLVEIDDPQGLLDLEAELEVLTGEVWSSHVSPHAVGNANGTEYYGYVWRDAEVTMNGALGFFHDPNDTIKREPYGANFTIGSFDFTLVVFHLQYGQSISTRRAEANQLVHVYDYFQSLNGAEQDVLIGGDFNLPGDDAAFTVVDDRPVTYLTDPEQMTTIGANGLANSFDNIFVTESTPLGTAGVLDFTQGNYGLVGDSVSDHLPVWVEVDPSTDHD